MIEIINLTFAYNRQTPLFNDLSLNLSPGHCYGLLGKNGAGKTTLLKIIAGLLFARSGAITVLNHDPAKRNAAMLSDCFFLSEEFVLPAISVKQYISLNAPLYPRFDSVAMNAYCKEFGIVETMRLDRISFGQKKKFAIAFGLASNCRLMIMDEPTNGLDIPTKSEFRRILGAFSSNERCIIISTHQVRDLDSLIDPLIILDNGKVLLNESMQSLKSRFASAITPQPESGIDIVYSEKITGGYGIIKKNDRSNSNNALDIELLFNAVTTQPASFGVVV